MQTTDINLASALVVEGHSIQDIEYTNKQGTFTFEDGSDLDRDVRDFWDGNLRVNPLELFNKRQNLKQRMWNVSR